MAKILFTSRDNDILALFTPDEFDRWLAYEDADKQPPKPEAVILDIPHLCQYGPGADKRKNDCGAACVAMVVRGLTEGTPTVDDIAIRFQQAVNKYMSFGELLHALQAFGLIAHYERPLRADAIKEAILDGQPVIALVKYPKLPHQAITFNGSHFIVVYGVEADGFVYHDPLEAKEYQLAITPEQLETAMSGFAPGENLPYQGIVITA